MATPGLSLLGFLDEPEAIALLRDTCVVADGSDAALSVEWQAARAKLGTAYPRAGQPDFQAIPAAGQAHLSQLVAQPWMQNALKGGLLGGMFQMVELAQLLAFQFHVDMARSDHHNGATMTAPSLADMLSMCLPLQLVPEGVRTNRGPNSVLVTCDGLNFQTAVAGVFPTPYGFFAGLEAAPTIPLLHVVRFNGRSYLHNGFHRAVGLVRRGVTHAPCFVRDVADAAAAGINPPQTFAATTLESANPPTVGHFGTGLAYDVNMKVFTRTIHVSWADHITTRD